MFELTHCTVCPRKCGANRIKHAGICGAGNTITIARAALHEWEEPCLSGTKGSGTIFFSGCSLQCCFCQNAQISHDFFGKEITPDRFAEICFELKEKGAHNINLVSASHFIPLILPILREIKPTLGLPIVFNSGGYESVETLQELEGIVDIYLPDFKFMSSQLAEEYCNAPDYPQVAMSAILEMYRQIPKPILNRDGIMQRGLIIRHMVMPNAMHDSMKVLDWIAKNLDIDRVFVSLMSQYTPCYQSQLHPKINRRISTYEYHKVYQHLLSLGIQQGYAQEKSSAKEEYIPPFDLTGVEKQ